MGTSANNSGLVYFVCVATNCMTTTGVDANKERTPSESTLASSLNYIAPPLPFAIGDAFKSLMTLPSDLQRFDEWARSQGFRDRAAIAACKSFYGPALQDQLRLSRETEPVTWAEFVRVSVYAAREILGGASLLVEVYGWKLRKAQEPRELWNSLQNAFRILYPAESEKAINSLCQNQLVMAIEEVNTKEKILRFLFSAPDVSPSVLLNKVSDSLRKYRSGKNNHIGQEIKINQGEN